MAHGEETVDSRESAGRTTEAQKASQSRVEHAAAAVELCISFVIIIILGRETTARH